MSRYPNAEWVPWKYSLAAPAFYKGLNKPVAVVLHRMQGYKGTARMWAQQGYTGASWHFTVGLDGSVMQHLEFEDGGYHAGIPSTAPKPTWPLWRGHGQNVNHYTIGVECEGFAGGAWPDEQLSALRLLGRWLSDTLGILLDHAHFPAHAEIDIINRVNDFDTPEWRDTIVYPYLFANVEGEPMTDDELLAVFSGKEEAHLTREQRLTNARFRRDEAAAGRAPSIRDMAAGSHAHSPVEDGVLVDHSHVLQGWASETGGVLPKT